MKRKNFGKVSGLLLLAAALLLWPGPAPAEMYLEAYLGGVQGANAPMRSGVSDASSFSIGPISFSETFTAGGIPGRLDPAVMGGLKLGTWFVKEGFLGYNYPEWMKYFGFYLDFMVHRLDFRRQAVNSLYTATTTYTPAPGGPSISATTATAGAATFWSEGFAPTLAFMFAGRYGFLPDSEVPFGRLQPYVAVGPGILFFSQQPSLRFDTLGGIGAKMDSKSEAVICLAAEAGVRWMCLKNVSIDLSFKYRYAQPSLQYNYSNPLSGTPASLTLDPTLHLFSGQLGAAYHF